MITRSLSFVGAALLFTAAIAVEASAAEPTEAPAGNPADAPPPPPPPVVIEAAPMAPPPPPAPPAAAGPPAFKLEAGKGNSVKVGLLFQPQFQSANSATPVAGVLPDGYSNNFYIRRTRLLVGGTLFGVFEYFFDTDFANLFFAQPVTVTTMDAMGNPVMTTTMVKTTPGMNIQDAFITWKAVGDMFKIDMGYMLPPLAHNAVQGATTLYSWDYFGNTFNSGNSFGASATPVGRDAGLQLRGLVAGGRVEYRAGLFQGLRNAPTATEVGARNFFRATARVQVNLLDPETGFFYAGSYLGAKKILSVGGSADIQDEFKYFAGDVFVDMPLGPGIFTAQVNVAHWNGGAFIALPSQTAVMGEVGFAIGDLKLAPIVRAERLFLTGDNNDTTRLGGGLALFAFNHNSNLKLFYTNIKGEAASRGVNQINLQWQLYFF